MSKKTCRTADDVTSALGLPVLGVVPTMLTPAERQRKAAKRRLVRLAIALVVLVGVFTAVLLFT